MGSSPPFIEEGGANTTQSPLGSVSSWKQYVILMRKNWISTKRNRVVTAAQLLMPVFFIFLLYLLSSSIQNMSKASIEISKITHPKEYFVDGVPRFECFHEMYAPCYTIAYVPSSDPVVSELVKSVAANSGLEESDLIGFNSANELDEYILAHPWSVQGGYVFLQWQNGVWEYAVQYNDTTTKHISHLFEDYSAANVALPMASMMDREIIRYQQKISNSTTNELDYTFSTMQFPQRQNLRNDFMMYMFPVFFLAMMMLYFVTMARGLVKEKELKLKEGMRMMGLKELPYWASWFSYNILIVFIASLVAIVAGHIFSLNVVTSNDFRSVFILVFLFGISMLGLAFLLASLQDRSALTLTTGFIMWVISASVFSTLHDNIYTAGKSMIVANILSLYSPFAFSKGMFDLSRAAFEENGRTFADRNSKEYSDLFWLSKVYYYLILDTVIYIVVAFYITMVWPGEFGVPKPFYFFLTPSYWTGRTSKHAAKRRTKFTPHQVVDDTDVIEEEKRVKNMTYPPNTVVVIEDLMKVYKSGIFSKPFTAVKGLSVAMQNNQLFCLLGPNGAGKSTTFNMLCGIFPSSAGDANLFGYSIVHEMDEIRKLMGVCPQHDLLWDEMTGKEHLEFFCRFKGVPEENVAAEAAAKLALVGLTNEANVPTSVYSGGEKRRLSVALATVGDPKIVFLDEPTTGMDPVSRQDVWKVISDTKKGRVVILTTHSMEEADVLSDRIGIVAHGQLRCIGTNIHLKSKFGSGYQLTLVYPAAQASSILQGITEFVDKQLPTWSEFFAAGNATPQSFTITIPYDRASQVAELLKTFEEHASALGIEEITMNLSSLEEVFIKIAMESQKETSLSMEAIAASSKELAQLANSTAQTIGTKTPFKRQANALMRKHASFYKRSYSTLIVQLFIPVLFMLALLGTSSRESFNFEDDPHPAILPPQVPFQPKDPVRFTIPYVYPDDSLGSCCGEGTSNGFLGLIDFQVLNATNSTGLPQNYSLGEFGTTDFTFQRYPTDDAMFSMLYDTTESGWLMAFIFDSFDIANNRFHVGYLKNVSEWGARGSVAGVNLIDNALLAATTSPNNSLTVRIKQFPSWKHELKMPGTGAAGTWVLLGCSFFMVPILALIVREKHDRLRNLMNMAGMRMVTYWVVLFVIGLIAYFILMLFWICLGFIVRAVAFTHIAVGALILLFFTYAFCQVGIAFFVSTFFTDEATASLVGYTYILFFVILTQSIVAIIVNLGDDTQMYGVAVLPPFAVTILVNAMSTYYYPSGGSMSMSDFNDDRASKVLAVLFGVGVFLLIFHSYIEQVWPSTYGIPKHPLFLLKKWRTKKQPTFTSITSCFKVEVENIEMGADVPDVARERAEAREEYNREQQTSDLVVPGVSKYFAGEESLKAAVNNVPMVVPHLECYGLLGPNGGGKTTLVNLLSGLYPVSSGDAKVKGCSVVENLAEAQRYMGLCPQDSVLWGELSAREHLNLFGRLRNLSGEQLEAAVNLTLKQVLLTDAADRPAGGYSGGMKRRLSLAIALIGCPSVVLLDEPTTGVDPFSRHVVWDAIRAYKQYCTIILITHNMEEADALCDRVGMLHEGKMVCVGKPRELKTRYNVGYTLIILHKSPNPDHIITLVRQMVPNSQTITVLPHSCVFMLPKTETRLSNLFSEFSAKGEDLSIDDWAVLPSNLEDVLIKSTHSSYAHE
jgi:ABC-type multidrug transport system ATPase subunit